MPQMKYEKHNARQYEQILRAARQLFVEKGIERVSFSAVADSCGIARATLYKYFPDKESLLWAIHRQALRTFGNALLARAEARPLTALERFSVYFEELARRFELDPDFLLFFDLFEKTYQAETARRGSAVYGRMFRPGDFGSGDTARFLCENFNDGSLRAGLDAQLTVFQRHVYCGVCTHRPGKRPRASVAEIRCGGPGHGAFFIRCISARHQRRRSSASMNGLKRKKRAASGLGCGTLSVLSKEWEQGRTKR